MLNARSARRRAGEAPTGAPPGHGTAFKATTWVLIQFTKFLDLNLRLRNSSHDAARSPGRRPGGYFQHRKVLPLRCPMLENLQTRVLGIHNDYVEGYKKGYTAGLKVILIKPLLCFVEMILPMN